MHCITPSEARTKILILLQIAAYRFWDGFSFLAWTTNLLFHKKRLAVLVSSAAMANITREEGGSVAGERGWSCSSGGGGGGGGRYINGEFGRHDSPRKVSNESSIKQSFRVGHGTQKGKEGREGEKRWGGRPLARATARAVKRQCDSRSQESVQRGLPSLPPSRFQTVARSILGGPISSKAIGSRLSFFLPSFPSSL